MNKNTCLILVTLFLVLFSCEKTSDKVNSFDSELIAYYPFDGNANDESGNGYSLSVKGATLTKDRFGNDLKAYHFNGENAMMEIPNLAKMDTVSLFSISLWLRADEILGESYLISLRSMVNGNDGVHYMCVEKVNSDFYSRNGISNCTKTDLTKNCITRLYKDTISNLIGHWIHIVLGQKKGTSKYDKYHTFLYVNGKKRIEANYISDPLSFKSGGVIGSVIWGYYGFFKGDLDDIRIYNKALTEEEIQLLYKLKY